MEWNLSLNNVVRNLKNLTCKKECFGLIKIHMKKKEKKVLMTHLVSYIQSGQIRFLPC